MKYIPFRWRSHLYMEINKKLKEARANSGLTQEQVAEKIMVSRQTISNWENGKSLPDIVSVINMSDLYQISLDELLKGDQRMKAKLEKDVDIFKRNKCLILMTGILVLVVAIIYLISACVGGSFHNFCESAAIWVLMGIGVACGTAYISQKE